jgi:hypothetical protein
VPSIIWLALLFIFNWDVAVSNVIDQAQERDAQQLQEALTWQAARALATPSLVATGECRNAHCALPLAPVLVDGQERQPLFCGPKCAVQHEKTLKLFPTTAVHGRRSI